MERPRRRRPQPEIEVHRVGRFHLLLEPVDDLDALVKAVRLVELLGRGGVLQAPGPVGPDVHLAHRADDAGIQHLFDPAPHRRRVPLVPHLGRELWILRGGLANQPRLPDVVGQRLLAIHVLAVGQRQVGRERVRVLGGGDDHRVELAHVVEHLPEIVQPARLGEAGGRGLDRVVVHVAEDGDVLVWMRARCGVRGATAAAAAPLTARRDGELVEARVRAAAARDERDAQLIVQILPAQQRRGASHDAGSRDGPADELPPRHPAFTLP